MRRLSAAGKQSPIHEPPSLFPQAALTSSADAFEAEREKRVVHLQHVAARRIGNRHLARGWTAWFFKFDEARRQRQMLLAAGGRLLRPKLSAALAHWRTDWEVVAAERREKARTARRDYPWQA